MCDKLKGGSELRRRIQNLKWLAPGALLLALTLPAGSALALGPWKAQIVDADSKQPVAGVVVLAVWTKVLVGSDRAAPSFIYYDSEEVVADQEGRISIAARDYSMSDAQVFAEPEFFFFKPGYGQWRFQGEDAWLKLEASEKRKRYVEAGQRFAGLGVVIEITPLKTRQERAQYYRERIEPLGVPAERRRLWLRAVEEERAYLDL
jgi:hypothetical protein